MPINTIITCDICGKETTKTITLKPFTKSQTIKYEITIPLRVTRYNVNSAEKMNDDYICIDCLEKWIVDIL